MEIEIDRLNIQLSGMVPARAQSIGQRVSAALEAELGPYAALFSSAPAGYRAPWITLPGLRVNTGASDDEIAQQIANALARALLLGLEVD